MRRKDCRKVQSVSITTGILSTCSVTTKISIWTLPYLKYHSVILSTTLPTLRTAIRTHYFQVRVWSTKRSSICLRQLRRSIQSARFTNNRERRRSVSLPVTVAQIDREISPYKASVVHTVASNSRK